jgi:PTH1 family peptidyl-tRNA hydrolase
LGECKIQTNRSSAGHNGVQSIVNILGTKDFERMRLGVAATTDIRDTADFVLSKFSDVEKNILSDVIAKQCDHIL